MSINEQFNTIVTDDDKSTAWVDKYGVSYSPDRKRLLRANSKLIDYKVAEGTEIICDYAFFQCSSIKTIDFPDSLKCIGAKAFNNCVKLDSITLPQSLVSIRGNSFSHSLSEVISESPHFVVSDNMLFDADMESAGFPVPK